MTKKDEYHKRVEALKRADDHLAKSVWEISRGLGYETIEFAALRASITGVRKKLKAEIETLLWGPAKPCEHGVASEETCSECIAEKHKEDRNDF